MRYGEVNPTGRRLRWPYVLFVLLAVTLAVGIVVVANAAEPTSALIEFTSPQDFQAKLDSIRAVCDTTITLHRKAHESCPGKIHTEMLHHQQQGDSVEAESHYKYWFIEKMPTIRCRTHVWAVIIFFSGNKPKAYVAWEWEER